MLGRSSEGFAWLYNLAVVPSAAFVTLRVLLSTDSDDPMREVRATRLRLNQAANGRLVSILIDEQPNKFDTLERYASRDATTRLFSVRTRLAFPIAQGEHAAFFLEWPRAKLSGAAEFDLSQLRSESALCRPAFPSQSPIGPA